VAILSVSVVSYLFNLIVFVPFSHSVVFVICLLYCYQLWWIKMYIMCWQGLGVVRAQLSLRDSSCHPVENATHYVWTLGLSECGTVMSQHHAVVSYDNSVGRPQSAFTVSIVTVRAVATDCIVFVGVFFSVSTITHDQLHSAWWNFAGTCASTTCRTLLNFKVIGQRWRSFFSIVDQSFF